MFDTHVPNNDDLELLNEIISSDTEVWFTDASVTNDGIGYGYYNYRTESSSWGYIGKAASIPQAEITAILNCAIEIARDNLSTTPVCICTDSTAAIKAIKATKLTSRIVTECVETLEIIARRRPIKVLWVPSHSNIVGNEIADNLAKMGARTIAAGPEPFLPLEEKHIRTNSELWLQSQIPLKWVNMNTCNHTKKFLTRPSEAFSQKLLSLNKKDMRIVIGIITGHVRLNAHLSRMGIRADPDCDHCSHLEETAFHFLCECTGFTRTRRRIFGNEAITSNDVMSKPLSKIIAFVQQSERFINDDRRLLLLPSPYLTPNGRNLTMDAPRTQIRTANLVQNRISY